MCRSVTWVYLVKISPHYHQSISWMSFSKRCYTVASLVQLNYSYAIYAMLISNRSEETVVFFPLFVVETEQKEFVLVMANWSLLLLLLPIMVAQGVAGQESGSGSGGNGGPMYSNIKQV